MGVLGAPESSAAGSDHVRRFGSVAREEETGGSDVDLLVTLHPEGVLSLAGDAEEVLGSA
jgi:predicted nucleotidyltransferase